MDTSNGDITDKTPLRILFVEDEQLDVELAVSELEREGFRVSWDCVESEPALRNTLATDTYEIVLSDYSMPHFDGLNALRVVQEVAPDLPFIFLSGTIGEERAIQSIRNGATDYVLKGNIRRLGTAVRRALAEKNDQIQARLAEEARSRLAAILEATSDFVAIASPDRRLIYVNNAISDLFAAAETKLLDTDMYKLYPQWSRELIESNGMAVALENGRWQGEAALLTGDGTEVPVSQVIIAHRDENNDVRYISTISRDIRERKAYEERIAYLANYDALTDLPNRRLLSDRVSQAITYGWRSDRSLSLLVVDIDRFKLVNDGFGQIAGDQLLKMVSDRLLETVRDGDTVARLGADTFAVFATDLANSEDILVVVRKIQHSLRRPFVINGLDEGREIHITSCIGASIYPHDGKDFDTLLRNSNAAMHRAKLQGQNSFQFFAAEMTLTAKDRVELENALHVALPRDELELYYQPQISLTTRKVVGVEALIRWKHPDHGWISPGRFIPVAENSELIFELGNWVLTRACRQLCEWGRKAQTQKIAVNVSSRQFLNDDFINIVSRVLHTTSLASSRLELELTESVLVEDKEKALIVINQLKGIGVKIAVDDFGTGYSSLSYLSHLPIDCLKIDQSFVQNFSSDPKNAAIVQAIISLGKSLGLSVLAEGIETEDQLAFLRSQGCHEGQGYLFSHPLPEHAVAPILSSGLMT